MRKRGRFILVLILWSFLASPPPRAEATSNLYSFSPKLQKAYSEIQNLRLDAARKLIREEKSSTPDNAFIAYLENYADTYYLLISEDKAAYQARSGQEDLRLAHLSSLPDSPYQRFLKAEIRLHWAFIKLKFGNEVSACWDIIKAYRLLEENKKKYPSFAPTLKSLGLLHILIGSVPEKYTWVTKVLGLRGDIALGLQELQKAKQQAPLFRFETELIDLLIHAYTLKLTPAQSDRLNSLPVENPDNLLIHFFCASILVKQARSEEALRILSQAPQGEGYLAFPFLYYLHGEILLQKGQFDAAFKQFGQFQKSTAGVNFIQDSYFKQFLCRWLATDTIATISPLNKIKKGESAVVEADKYALRFAEQYSAGKILPEHKVLFKARYACDGGYFPQSLSLLKNYDESDFSTQATKAEFNYRKARISQLMDHPELARPFYKRAILLSEKEGLYFGASASLQMGYICKENKEREQAIYYFRKALSFKKHEYKNSIDNKARASLSEMKAADE